MATMAREAWTDERLDDLKASVDAGFRDTRAEFRAMREELRTGREELREELKVYRQESREDMAELRVEMGALNRTIHQFMFAIVGTIFLGFTGTISALISLT